MKTTESISQPPHKLVRCPRSNNRFDPSGLSYAGVRDNVGRLYAELAERDPAPAQLAAAAVSGLATAGPELRRRVAVAFDGRSGVVSSAPLSVRDAGFSLHAATRAGAAEEPGSAANSIGRATAAAILLVRSPPDVALGFVPPLGLETPSAATPRVTAW